MSETPEVVETVDPGPGAQQLAVRSPGFKIKKLCEGAPGHLRVVNRNGSALSVGARAVEFRSWDYPMGLGDDEHEEFCLLLDMEKVKRGRLPSAVEQLNLYAESRANRTVVEIYPHGDKLLVFIDVFLDGKELDRYMRVNDRLATMMRELEEEEAKAQAEEETRAVAAEVQDKADLELGRKAREFRFAEKIRDLEATLKQVRAAANKLAKQHGVKFQPDEVADAD